MTTVTLNRFEWIKAVLQAESLTPAAAKVASAIAIQFANDTTGQINPSQETLADYVKLHRDTVKRVLRELRNAGWLMTRGDGGRGKAPQMRLISPSKIVPFRTAQRGGKSSSEPEKRGREKPREEITCPNVSIRPVYETETEVIADWNDWLKREGLPSVMSMPIRSSDAKGIFFQMPWKYPPKDPDSMSRARSYFLFRIQRAEVRYAAE